MVIREVFGASEVYTKAGPLVVFSTRTDTVCSIFGKFVLTSVHFCGPFPASFLGPGLLPHNTAIHFHEPFFGHQKRTAFWAAFFAQLSTPSRSGIGLHGSVDGPLLLTCC